jgi:hypothetical protein
VSEAIPFVIVPFAIFALLAAMKPGKLFVGVFCLLALALVLVSVATGLFGAPRGPDDWFYALGIVTALTCALTMALIGAAQAWRSYRLNAGKSTHYGPLLIFASGPLVGLFFMLFFGV